MRYGNSPADKTTIRVDGRQVNEWGQPIARTTDPASSHEAATRLEPKRMTLAEKAHGLVRTFPNSTYVELWQYSRAIDEGIAKKEASAVSYSFTSPESLMKRLNDARAKGWIESGEQRLCPVTGNKQLTWHVKSG